MTDRRSRQLEENRKEKITALMKEPSYVPMKEKELACLMQVSAEERPELKRLLQELILEVARFAGATPWPEDWLRRQEAEPAAPRHFLCCTASPSSLPFSRSDMPGSLPQAA